jgi:hypothetical protein
MAAGSVLEYTLYACHGGNPRIDPVLESARFACLLAADPYVLCLATRPSHWKRIDMPQMPRGPHMTIDHQKQLCCVDDFFLLMMASIQRQVELTDASGFEFSD